MKIGCQKSQPVTKKKYVSNVTFARARNNRYGETQAASAIPHPLNVDGELAAAAHDDREVRGRQPSLLNAERRQE
eukprot:15485484-Alexandrium_andersonii.AAC.1